MRGGRELVRRSRSQFPLLALTLAVPVIALLAFLGVRFSPQLKSTLSWSGVPFSSRQPLPSPQTAPGPPTRRIVLILDDVGYNERALGSLTALDVRLNFAVIPGTPKAKRSAEILASNGYEVLCHIPMEPVGYPKVSAGAGAILTSMSDEEIRVQTRRHLRSIPQARGANNHMGSRATRDRRVLNAMMQALKEQKAYFVDSVTTSGSLAASVAREHGVPSASRQVFLDHDATEPGIRRQLASLSEIAEKKGIAVGIAHMYPATVRVLQEEIPRLQARGFQFVSASQAVN